MLAVPLGSSGSRLRAMLHRVTRLLQYQAHRCGAQADLSYSQHGCVCCAYDYTDHEIQSASDGVLYHMIPNDHLEVYACANAGNRPLQTITSNDNPPTCHSPITANPLVTCTNLAHQHCSHLPIDIEVNHMTMSMGDIWLKF